MKQITFQKCSRALETGDLRNLESLIKASLPEDFRSHYMNYNGGLPSLDWFPARSGREPIWIQEFLPIESTVTKPDVSINSLYLSMTKKNILQGSALPFALDPGANFFCLDLKNGHVFYHLNDVFDPALEASQNQHKAQRTLTSSFADFIALLVSEDEAFS